MRIITDAHGTEWTVFEVRRMNQAGTARTNLLPEGMNEGWLCFESEIGKRRLGRYPANWREFSDRAIETLLRAAQPARARPSDRVHEWHDPGAP